jgi:prepilin-type N-terminal cleavage/methylation domain-containing protein
MPVRKQSALRLTDGFTLTELLITMAISGILLAAIVSTFLTQQKAYALQTQLADMRLNTRAALDRIVRDVRMAGYGVPSPLAAAWIDWVQDTNGESLTFTDSVRIVPGDPEPDTLSIVGCFDAPLAQVTVDTAAGETRLAVRYDHPTRKVNTTTKKVICIGRNEMAIVTESPRNSARYNTMTIDTDPLAEGNQGLAHTYRAEATPIELLQVITYSIDLDGRNYALPTPVLKRNTHTGGHAQPLAEYIEHLRLTQDGAMLDIALTGRAPEPDPTYTHPVHGDGYRRTTVTARVRLRNVIP